MQNALRLIPWSLVALRGVLAPAIAWLAGTRASGLWLAAIVLIALVSDIYDGVLARRWHCDTPGIRLADSMVDTVFYLAVLFALWTRQAALLKPYWPLLAVLFALEAVRFLYDLRKFSKAASYHSYLAKTWGLVMAVAVILVLALGKGAWLLAISLVLGICCDLEGLAMSIILPVWKNDVKTIAAALRLRRSLAGTP